LKKEKKKGEVSKHTDKLNINNRGTFPLDKGLSYPKKDKMIKQPMVKK